MNSSILAKDGTQTSTTNLGNSGTESNWNQGVL